MVVFVHFVVVVISMFSSGRDAIVIVTVLVVVVPVVSDVFGLCLCCDRDVLRLLKLSWHLC